MLSFVERGTRGLLPGRGERRRPPTHLRPATHLCGIAVLGAIGAPAPLGQWPDPNGTVTFAALALYGPMDESRAKSREPKS